MRVEREVKGEKREIKGKMKREKKYKEKTLHERKERSFLSPICGRNLRP